MSTKQVTMSMTDYDALMFKVEQLSMIEKSEHFRVRVVAFRTPHIVPDHLVSNVIVDALTEQANKQLAEHITALREVIGNLNKEIYTLKQAKSWWRF
tara:strand:- start:20287 stop:20577 length:291 start_codon:yes stop_codon:yes gene_type:complete